MACTVIFIFFPFAPLQLAFRAKLDEIFRDKNSAPDRAVKGENVYGCMLCSLMNAFDLAWDRWDILLMIH